MLENTKDILNLVLAFCAIWITIFLCWFLYYFAQAMRTVNQLVRDVEEKARMVFSAIDFIRDKMGILASAAGYLVQAFIGREEEKKKSKKK